MSSKKLWTLYAFYSGDWSPTVTGRVSLVNDRKKGETLDKTLRVDSSADPVEIRESIWEQVLPDKSAKEKREIGVLIYSMRIYRAACQKVNAFGLDDDFIPYEADELAVATPEMTEQFISTVRETFGIDSAVNQRQALRPTKEPIAAKRLEEIEATLPKLAPIKLPAAAKKTPTVKEIVGNYTMLVLTIHSIGNRRKVETDILADDKEDADKEWIAVSKKLLESDELRAINYTSAKCRQYVENRSLPSLVKKGIYIMNRAEVDGTVQRIAEDNDKIEGQADIFVRAYPGLLAEAKKRLKKRFNAKDYPAAEELKSRFRIDYQLLEIKPPQPEKMSEKVFREEKAKWEKLWSDAAANADQLLTAGMIEQMNLLIAKLSGDDGQPKQIRETALDNINEFLSTFTPRNMQSNAQLEALANRAKEIIKGVSPEVLRQSKNARTYVVNGFAQIKKNLEPMLEKRPVRAIDFD